MARCKECNEIYSEFYLVNGTCNDAVQVRHKKMKNQSLQL